MNEYGEGEGEWGLKVGGVSYYLYPSSGAKLPFVGDKRPAGL